MEKRLGNTIMTIY